ncbi:hypothetical protein DICPUDRAFT_85094 [Dictyostelium purpureum]|uniref:Palmitoyltransferase n=1 Tax=Dictyostelium purpureum TaxID=5786 RepID=F1A4P0_DICPU|nr:uncharacterized protein DICPUDRAFT_85094 [Dictyostelium purpureum]EGC28837.1 hypothetical protein DICPUDRAFT_85094 [Dictyostelium purpureum]|eukprot:XP_003294637.1 hypothetical protein DICPUDRAFT_85094 [Dictyostelium purpureum]
MVDFFDFVVLSSIIIILPLVNDFLNNTFPNAKIGRIASEIVGSILVLFIFHLVIAGVWLWYTYYLPYYYTKESIYSLGSLNIFDIPSKVAKTPEEESSIRISITLQAIFLFIVVTNIYHYFYRAIVADNYLPQLNKTKQQKLSDEQREKLCSQCTIYSKDKWSSLHINNKSFHCKICKRCTNAMDHHCPFINNCVGINNHHYFYLFLTYTYLAMIYACFLTYYPFMDCVYNKSQDLKPMCIKMDKYSYIFLCCLIVITAANGVFCFQNYLISTNSKTVQLLRKLKKSKTYIEWFKWIIDNFKTNFSFNNYKQMFTNWKLYNIIIPYKK